MRHPLPICGAPHPALASGNVCTEPEGHTGGHVATDGCGRPEYYWRPNVVADPVPAQTPEPTDEQRAHTIRGVLAFGLGGGYTRDDVAETLARYVREQVAAAVTTEQDRFAKLADTFDREAVILNKMALTVEDDDGACMRYAAERIREVLGAR